MHDETSAHETKRKLLIYKVKKAIEYSDVITRYMKYWNRYLMGGVNSMDCVLLRRKKIYSLLPMAKEKLSLENSIPV